MTTNSHRLPSPAHNNNTTTPNASIDPPKKRSITHQKPKIPLNPINSSLGCPYETSLEGSLENARYSVNEHRKKAVLRHLNNSALKKLSPETKRVRDNFSFIGGDTFLQNKYFLELTYLGQSMRLQLEEQRT